VFDVYLRSLDAEKSDASILL